jgi:hypothetical protein
VFQLTLSRGLSFTHITRVIGIFFQSLELGNNGSEARLYVSLRTGSSSRQRGESVSGEGSWTPPSQRAGGLAPRFSGPRMTSGHLQVFRGRFGACQIPSRSHPPFRLPFPETFWKIRQQKTETRTWEGTGTG